MQVGALTPDQLAVEIFLRKRKEFQERLAEEVKGRINNILLERWKFADEEAKEILAEIPIEELPHPWSLKLNRELLDAILASYRQAGWMTRVDNKDVIEFSYTGAALFDQLKAALSK